MWQTCYDIFWTVAHDFLVIKVKTCYDIFWTVAHDFLVIKVKRNDVDFFLQPFGGRDEDLPKLMQEIKEYNGGKPFEIHGIYEDGKERLLKAFPDLEITDDRDNWDYVYLQQKLATLAGRKYHGKKNHCNAFVKEYPDYVYEEMSRSNIDECIAFGDMWCEGVRKMRHPRSAEQF